MKLKVVQTRWKTLVPSIRASWSELTEDDLEEVGPSVTGLASLIHERYGLPRIECERQVENWLLSR